MSRDSSVIVRGILHVSQLSVSEGIRRESRWAGVLFP